MEPDYGDGDRIANRDRSLRRKVERSKKPISISNEFSKQIKEFKVNEYITVKLKGDETVIYIKGQKFLVCKFLLLDIPIDRVSTFDEIDSIDEAAEKLDQSLEPELDWNGNLRRKTKIQILLPHHLIQNFKFFYHIT